MKKSVGETFLQSTPAKHALVNEQSTPAKHALVNESK